MERNIYEIEKILKDWNLEYILQPGGDKDYYFVCIHRAELDPACEKELIDKASELGWDAQFCPDPESHIFGDKVVNESWEDNITVLNLL